MYEQLHDQTNPKVGFQKRSKDCFGQSTMYNQNFIKTTEPLKGHGDGKKYEIGRNIQYNLCYSDT